jgi:hypothetical protein
MTIQHHTVSALIRALVFKWLRSGLRIPSAPLIKWLKKALVGDAQHQDGDVVTGGLLLEVQSGALYTAGNGRSVESN